MCLCVCLYIYIYIYIYDPNINFGVSVYTKGCEHTHTHTHMTQILTWGWGLYQNAVTTWICSQCGKRICICIRAQVVSSQIEGSECGCIRLNVSRAESGSACVCVCWEPGIFLHLSPFIVSWLGIFIYVGPYRELTEYLCVFSRFKSRECNRKFLRISWRQHVLARSEGWACICIGWHALRAVLVSSYAVMCWGPCMCLHMHASAGHISMRSHVLRPGHVSACIRKHQWLWMYLHTMASICTYAERSLYLHLWASVEEMSMRLHFWSHTHLSPRP